MKILLYTVLVWFGVHWGYVMVMSAKRKDLTLYWKVMLVPGAVIEGILDFVFQFSFGWIMFLETPFHRGWLFSNRVQYHADESFDWRYTLALWWAKQLNLFDPGHIKIKSR